MDTNRRTGRWMPLLVVALATSACDAVPTRNLFSEAKRLAGAQLAQDLIANLQTVSTFEFNSLEGLTFSSQGLQTQGGPAASSGKPGSVPMKPGAAKPLEFRQGLDSMKRGHDKLARLKDKLKPAGEPDRENEKMLDGQKVKEQERRREVARGKTNESHSMKRTVDQDGSPLRVEGKASKSAGRGQFDADFVRVFNEDGSVDSTYSAVVVRKSDGARRTVLWVRHHATDGSMTGSGTITKFDGTTVSISLSRDANGANKIEASDSQAGVGVEVGQEDSSSKASSVITDLETRKSESSEQDADSVEPVSE